MSEVIKPVETKPNFKLFVILLIVLIALVVLALFIRRS